MSDSKVVAERFAMVRETDLKGATALPTTATKDLVNAYLMQGETIVTSIDVIAFNNVNGKNMVGRQGVLFITASSQGHHKLKVIMMSETNQVNISESGMRKQSIISGTEQALLKQVSTKHTLDGFFTTIDLCKVRDSWHDPRTSMLLPMRPSSDLVPCCVLHLPHWGAGAVRGERSSEPRARAPLRSRPRAERRGAPACVCCHARVLCRTRFITCTSRRPTWPKRLLSSTARASRKATGRQAARAQVAGVAVSRRGACRVRGARRGRAPRAGGPGARSKRCGIVPHRTGM